jgi:methyltransferase (TIGR00027 family)
VETDRASRTAVFVCQGRAVADGRLAVGRFSDPVAVQLLRGEELRPVHQARAGALPASWRERLPVEAVLACAEVVVPRTVAIDDAVAEAVGEGCRQVVVVGAGLDTRPWRLAALRNATVFALDHPASQGDTRERTAGLTPVAGRLELLPVDLATGGLGEALAAAGHTAADPTVWIWEGVVPYLAAAEVAATLRAIAGRSAPGSVLVVNYQRRSWDAAVGRRLFRLVSRLSRYEDPLAREPWRSTWTPEAMRQLLRRNGFSVRMDEDLLSLAQRLAAPVTHRGSLANGRVAVAVAA